MQFQSDISDVVVKVPDSEELSGIGPAYAVGIALNIWDKSIFHQITRKKYLPQMKKETRNKKYTLSKLICFFQMICLVYLWCTVGIAAATRQQNTFVIETDIVYHGKFVI